VSLVLGFSKDVSDWSASYHLKGEQPRRGGEEGGGMGRDGGRGGEGGRGRDAGGPQS